MPRIGIVEPVSSGLALVDAAVARGCDAVVFTAGTGDRALPRAYRDRVAALVAVDTNDEGALARAVADRHRSASLDALLPGFEYYVPSVARIAASVGLPGLPVDRVDAVRDKYAMRRRLEAAGLAVPRYAAVATAAELERAAREVGFPAVLKPSDASGSLHVTRVDTLEEARRAFEAATRDTRDDLDRRPGTRLQLESYIDGPEVSVEGYIGPDGRPVVVSITEKSLGPPPYFVETGHLVEADLPPSVRAAVGDTMTGAAAALGLTLGPFHGEMRLAGTGPVVIEIAARLGGDRICDLVRLAKGIDLPAIAIDCHRGAPPAEPPAAHAGHAGIRFFLRPGLASYARADGLDRLAAMPGYVEHGLTLGPGEPIPAATDFRARVGHAIFRADDHESLAERLAAADRRVDFVPSEAAARAG